MWPDVVQAGRNWSAAEFEDAVAEMFRRLPGVMEVVRQARIGAGEDRPVTVDLLVQSTASTNPLGLPRHLFVEVTGKRGGAAIRPDLERLRAVGVTDGEGLIVAPWNASRETREIAAPFQIWDREHLLKLAEEFPDALTPVLPFLEKAKPPPAAGEPEEPRFQPTVSVEQTDKGWRLPCDAFVLPLGEGGALKGATFEAFASDTGGGVNGIIRKVIGDKRLVPERPLVCPLAVFGLPPRLVLATAYRRVGEVYPGAAIAAIINTVAAAGLSQIVLPLIGANLAGETTVIEVIKAETERIRLVQPLHITIVVVSAEAADFVRKLFPYQQSVASVPSIDPVPLIRADILGDGTLVDRLGVNEQARTFARLLAATSTPMPLAVGLFGDWGSGKSFFMTLIRQEMEKIAATSREGGGYCTKVAHITFNAWHYVDSDLWASLALRIFDGVAAALAKDGTGGTQESREAEERRKLAEGTAASRRLKAELEALRLSRSDMESKVAVARKDRQVKAASYEAADLLKALAAVKDAACWAETKALLARFGVAEPKDLAELEKSLASVNGVVGSFGALLPGWLIRRSWLRYGVLLLGLVGLTFLVPLWESASDWVFSWIKVKVEPLGPLAASAVALAAWVAKRLETIKGVPAHIEDLRKRLEAAKGALRRDKAEERPLAALDLEIETLERRIAEADQELAAAAARLQQIESGALVYDFLRERGADKEYRGRTGIISVLREDLSRLQDQLKALNSDKAGVQRIVLYIDDLDRCEPDQVVDVLQAVHLLLAFELFAVVVAVDARWLERSLYRRYLDGDGTMTDDEREAGDFSPQNYLEKIFQLPYRIPAIANKPFGDLVSSLVVPEVEQPENKDRPASEGGRSKATPEPLGGGEKEDQSTLSEAAEDEPEHHDERNDGAETALQAPTPPPEKPPYLELLPEETEAIKRLHRFVPTPRAVKRLVNVYVMIRMQISAEKSSSLDELKNGGAWGLILLLGIDVGFPRASQVLRHLLEQEGTEFADWSVLQEKMKTLCPSDRPHLREQMEKLAVAVNGVTVLPDLAGLPRWLPYVDRFSFHSAALPE